MKKAKADKEPHGEFESECPGVLFLSTPQLLGGAPLQSATQVLSGAL